MLNEKTITPAYRYALRGEIYKAGFRSCREFARKSGVDPGYLSRIITGHIFPSAHVQKIIASELGVTLREFRFLYEQRNEQV